MLAPREKLWPAHPALVEAALDLLGVASPAHILGDFGCGDGPALFAAAARGARAVGWEIHAERAAALAGEVARRGLGASITVIAGNALEARFEGEGEGEGAPPPAAAGGGGEPGAAAAAGAAAPAAPGAAGAVAAPLPTHVYLYLIARGLRLMLPILRRVAARQPGGVLRVVTALYAIEGLAPLAVQRVSTAGEGRTPLYLYEVGAQ